MWTRACAIAHVSAHELNESGKEDGRDAAGISLGKGGRSADKNDEIGFGR